MKVRATNAYQRLNIPDQELNRIPLEGEEWEVTEERYKILSDPQKNGFNEIFVREVKEKKVETAVKKEPKKRNAKK